MSAHEYLAGVCRYMSLALVRAASHVPKEKRDWSPMGAARPVWEQLLECAFALEVAKKWIETGEFAFGNYEAAREEARLAPPSLETLSERLMPTRRRSNPSVRSKPSSPSLTLEQDARIRWFARQGCR